MNAPVATPQPMNIHKRVEQYVQLRDLIKQMDDAHKKIMAPYRETLEQLNSVLLKHLETIGADSAATPSGTVYQTVKKSASIADMKAFWDYVVRTQDFDLVDKKANVSAVDEYITRQVELAKSDPTIMPAPPPGVNFSTTNVVGVRRA